MFVDSWTESFSIVFLVGKYWHFGSPLIFEHVLYNQTPYWNLLLGPLGFSWLNCVSISFKQNQDTMIFRYLGEKLYLTICIKRYLNFLKSPLKKSPFMQIMKWHEIEATQEIQNVTCAPLLNHIHFPRALSLVIQNYQKELWMREALSHFSLRLNKTK